MSDAIRCRFCERPVLSIVTQRDGKGAVVAELFYHEGGEIHFFDAQPEEAVESINIPVEKQDG